MQDQTPTAGGLEVIGAGFGRTGTHSLAKALDILGYGPCYHMLEVGRNEGHTARWEDAMEGAPVDWPDLLRGYRSAVEWPAVAFLPDLAQAFPKAKFILTLRPAVEWYASASSTIFEGLELSEFNPNTRGKPGAGMARRLILEKVFSGRHRDRDFALQVYRDHQKRVEALVPPDRLLMFSVREGWALLCSFLGRPVPTEPFPRVNAREDFLATAPEWAREILKKRGGSPGC